MSKDGIHQKPVVSPPSSLLPLPSPLLISQQKVGTARARRMQEAQNTCQEWKKNKTRTNAIYEQYYFDTWAQNLAVLFNQPLTEGELRRHPNSE